MKKTIILIAVAVVLGGICGNALFQKYEDTSFAFKEDKTYFLQEGVYSSMESLNSNTKDINPKLVVRDKNKYYVYVGISSSLDGINKIQKFYKEKGYHTSKKQMNVTDTSFLVNLVQYDVLLDSAKTVEDVLTIEEVVLSNYEEVTKS